MFPITYWYVDDFVTTHSGFMKQCSLNNFLINVSLIPCFKGAFIPESKLFETMKYEAFAANVESQNGNSEVKAKVQQLIRRSQDKILSASENRHM